MATGVATAIRKRPKSVLASVPKREVGARGRRGLDCVADGDNLDAWSLEKQIGTGSLRNASFAPTVRSTFRKSPSWNRRKDRLGKPGQVRAMSRTGTET
jgi:hypothetical protein